MSNRKKAVTAAELMGRLQHDHEYRIRINQVEEQQQESIRRQKLVAEPMIQDLIDAGFFVQSVDELRRAGRDYQEAIPVLLKWLSIVQEEEVKDAIVRALSVPQATRAASPLIAEFKAARGSASGLKWTIGNALAVVGNDCVFDEIVQLVKDKRNGKSREMLALALGNMTNPAAVDALIELLNDDETAGHALMGLAKLKAPKSRSHIERFLNHPKSWVRKEASKALAKLNK